MNTSTRILSVLFVAMGASSAVADGVRVPMPGFQCYQLDDSKLKASADARFRGQGLPSVFEGPSLDARKVGGTSAIVYVKWPIVQENGFVQVLRFGRSLAWIQSDFIRPLYKEHGSKGGCRLYWDGSMVRYELDPGAKFWTSSTGSNMPDGWRMR